MCPITQEYIAIQSDYPMTHMQLLPVKIMIAGNYDTSWDLIESNKGYLPIDDDAFAKVYQEWETRNWPVWLKEHLPFPLTVERIEDDDDAYFTDIAKHNHSGWVIL